MKLLESRPEDIEGWCVKVREAGPKGKYMIDPLVNLNYNKLSPKVVNTVENALFYATFGHDKGASPKTEPTPGFSARSTSPRRRSSSSLSVGAPKPPRAV